MIRKYVFGPVASRRLGISLGVDLVHPKTCSFNCIYCEAKETTKLTLERQEYVPINEVIAELDAVLKSHPMLDYITFSGSGEPTLNSRIGQVVHFLKRTYPQYRLCLLTNGFLLGNPSLCREISEIDRIVPSLDASNAEEFQTINRPAPGLDFDRFLKDLTNFCCHSEQEIFLEIFIVPGVNDSDESIANFVKIVRPMQVDLVQLNTLDRPGTVDWIQPSEPSNTRRFIAAMEPFVPVEAVDTFHSHSKRENFFSEDIKEMEKRILELVSRRPATIDDLEVALSCQKVHLYPILDQFCKSGLLKKEKNERGTFYSESAS